MNRIIQGWAWLAVVLVVLGMVSPGRAETSEEARAYFRNGVELLTSSPPNYQDAYYQFLLAYEKSGENWKVLGNLGLCALKLERDAEAIEYYSEYIKRGEGELSEEEINQVKRDLLLVRGNMAKINISSDIPDLEVGIRRTGSSVPVQTFTLEEGNLEIPVRAGTQKVTASYEGRQLVWEVPLSPGQTKIHTFTFAEPEAAPAVASSPSSPDETSPIKDAPPPARKKGMSGLRIAGIATAGVGVGAFVAGAIFGSSARTKQDEARAQAGDPDVCLANSDGDNVCTPGAEDAFDTARSDALLANIFFIGGGVLTAGGVTMIVLGGNKSSAGPSASLELAPSVSPGGGGISAFGRF